MAKRSVEKSNCHSVSSVTLYEDKKTSFLIENSSQHNTKPPQKLGLIKSESSPSICLSNDTDDKINRDLKKPAKTVITESEKIRPLESVRLSQFVIVDSVLKETSIDSKIDASLPLSLHSIYQQFINSKQYTENFQAKDEFYRGVGLLGIGIEDRIYSKRKILEESLKRGFRLRSNPKPKKQFDGTVIGRSHKNRGKLNLMFNEKQQDYDNRKNKVKYNVFTIGNESLKKGRRHIRKSSQKKNSVTRRAAAQKLELAKKALNEASFANSDDSDDNDQSKSIALSRTKRQPKVPQLDFKYCYSNDGFATRSTRKCVVVKEDQFMEIVDSDSSSSVVEVFPASLIDKENSERRPSSPSSSNRARKSWCPRDNRALNLLDKLRLGLQCTVIQTEKDVIIQNLTVEDLSTLRSRLQGLATFKNIEAEYDRNGVETARATIDRRVLNLPIEATRSASNSCNRRKLEEDSLKRKKLSAAAKDDGKDDGNVNKSEDYSSNIWVRPKLRTVKKVRKLYTQCASTPNILARPSSSSSSATATAATKLSQCHNLYSQSSMGIINNNSEVSVSVASSNTIVTTPVSFYPQITSSEPHESLKMEPLLMSTIATSTFESSSPSYSSSSMDTFGTDATNGSKRAAATAMSASQLLMLRKGGSQHNGTEGAGTNHSSSSSSTTAINTGSATGSSSVISMTGNDQLFANHILKPFKKTIPASSPSKLEIDDEEAEFELTPSLIAAHANPTSRPLIQAATNPPPPHSGTGVIGNSAQHARHTIHISAKGPRAPQAPSPFFRNTATIAPSVAVSNHRLLTPSSKLPTVAVLPPRVAVDPVTTATAIISTPTSVTTPTNSNPKVRHRKWTHNFLTSNSINFREVLCAAAASKKSTITTPLPLVAPLAPTQAPMVTIASPPSPIVTVVAAAAAIVPSTPTKGSSVVLKSLLVGAHSHSNSQTPGSLWASKFLGPAVAAVGPSLQDSKIKWQVGGSVIPSSQPIFATSAIVSKENKAD